MSPLAEAPITTAERFDRPELYAVPDGEYAEYPDDPERSNDSDSADDEPLEHPRLYIVSDAEDSEGPNVYLARDAAYETFTQARYKRWFGTLAARRTVEVTSTRESADETNLLEKVRQARDGSVEALSMVGNNVGTATAEACFKDRHVTEVTMQRDEAGGLIQFGQTMRSVHTNALTMRQGRHRVLQEITHIEALNGHRIEDSLKAGVLEDYYFVVPSIVPDGVPENDLGHKGDGYFLDSLTFVVQATSERPNGEVTTESAFMAGVEAAEGDTFEAIMAKRYDIRALTRVYEQLGFEPPRTAAEFLNGGLYIPKELMPNGVVDFMRWCDEATDEVLSREVERQPEDYAAVIEESKRREASLADTRQKVIDDLLGAADTLATPMDAVRLMWDLVKKHTVDASFNNTYIDPRVFGAEAAGYIVQVRQHILNGDEHLAQDLMQRAQETAVVVGCGGGSSSESANGDKHAGSEDGAAGGGTEVLKCVTCPFCKNQVDAIVKHERDEKIISCPKCKVSKRYKK